MNLFDLLTRKNEITDYSKNMPPLHAQPQIEAIQLDASGAPIAGVEVQPERKMTIGDKFKSFSSNFGNKLTDALLGKSSQPTDSINTNGEMSVTVSENPRIGGLLNDIASGYRENRNTPFSIENLEPNKNKGIGYRVGEGLGSAVRFGESPAGRALLVSGLVGLTGGNGLQALTFGTSTGMQNQANRMNDKIYRNDLINTQQQALMNSPEFNQLSEAEQKQILDQLHTDNNYMGLSKEEAKDLNAEQYRAKLGEKQTNMKNKAIEDYLIGRQSQQLQDIANKVNGYRGYLGEKTYGNLINSQQLRDNAAYRRMYYDNQLEQNRAMNAYRQLMLEFQKQKEASDRAYQNAQLGLGYAKLSSDNENRRLDRIEKAKDRENKILNDTKSKEAEDTLSQIYTIRNLIKQNPRATGLAKGFLTGDVLNRIDNKKGNIETRVAIDALRTKIRHDLTGAQFSPKEAREYEKFLPNDRDNSQIINAKLDALEKRYKRDFGVSLMANTPQTYQSGKYTVRIK